jgi:hypothetical protein
MGKSPLFNQSYASLEKFYGMWLRRIEERCKSHPHRQASFYVWVRYSMSVDTLDAIYDPRLIPDISVICRGCLEFDVSLASIMKDEEVAHDYLEFDKHAKAHYLKILRKQGDIDHLLIRREQFTETFGEEFDDFGRKSWCESYGGITGLIKKFGRTHDLPLYNMLSHFAHGSIWAMQTLDGHIQDPEKTLAMMVESVYARYLKSSRSFIWFVWEPITTPEGERCKSDFMNVISAPAAEITQ